MESNGYVFTICLLLGAFFALTPYFVFKFLVSSRIWYPKNLETIATVLIISLFFVGYASPVFFNEVFGETIAQFPFWVKIIIISALGVIDFFEFLINFCSESVFSDKPTRGGGGLPHPSDEFPQY